MSQFVYLFRISPDERREAMGTPEQVAKSMKLWLDWIRGLEANGHLKNPGHPLDSSGAVIRGPRKTVTDGPYVEVKDMVAGFIVVEARDMAEAVELAGGCPMILGMGSVEVRPVGQAPA